MEAVLTQGLTSRLENFDMGEFSSLLQGREDQIDEELLDLLTSFTDFNIFKEIMLSHKALVVATTPKIVSKKAQALGLVDPPNIGV